MPCAIEHQVHMDHDRLSVAGRAWTQRPPGPARRGCSHSGSARSIAGRSRTWSFVRVSRTLVLDVACGADRDGDALLAPEVALVEEDVGYVMIGRVDDQSLNAPDRAVRRACTWSPRRTSTSSAGTRSAITRVGPWDPLSVAADLRAFDQRSEVTEDDSFGRPTATACDGPTLSHRSIPTVGANLHSGFARRGAHKPPRGPLGSRRRKCHAPSDGRSGCSRRIQQRRQGPAFVQ